MNYENELFLAIGKDHPDLIVLRYLRARKWNVELALKQLFETLQWRSQWGMEELLKNGEMNINQEEIQSGKTSFIGYDRMNRPINYVPVRYHFKGQFPIQSTEKLTVLTMEIGRKLLHEPIESVTVLFDLTDFSLKNMDYQHVRFLIHLLEHYYPESLGLGLIVNAPWIFNSCWYMIKSWLDPVVQQKIHFIKNLDELNEFIDPKLLPKHLNGSKEEFHYIRPTNEDLNLFKTLRNDCQGERKAKENHQKAIDHFVDSTRQWIENESFREQRNQSIQQLKQTFEQLIPYVQTKTHYHRSGDIHEPIFDLLYQKIRNQQ